MSLLEYFSRSDVRSRVRVSIDICLTSGRAAHFDDRARALGANLYYVQYSRSNARKFITEFRALLDNGRYDVIHDHQDYTAGWHFLSGAGHLPKVRVVHLHNTYLTISRVLATTPLRKLTVRTGKFLVNSFATDVLGTSAEVIRDYGFTSERPVARVVRCGIDVSRFAIDRASARSSLREEFGWSDDTNVMLFVGRLDGSFNQKNHPFAANVASRLIDSGCDCKLLVTGAGGALLEEARDMIAASPYRGSIVFAGLRDDVPRLMRGSDLLLFPSIAEGLGMVAVEAQAAGLKVLASDRVPRECEIVSGAVRFLSLDNGVDAWAESAGEILAQPDPDHGQWNRLVQESPYSIEQSASALVDVYVSRLSSR